MRYLVGYFGVQRVCGRHGPNGHVLVFPNLRIRHKWWGGPPGGPPGPRIGANAHESVPRQREVGPAKRTSFPRRPYLGSFKPTALPRVGEDNRPNLVAR